MIIFISDSLFLLYVAASLMIIITIYKCIKAKKLETRNIVVILIGIVYLLFYSYESLPSERVQYNHMSISEVEGLSEKEISRKHIFKNAAIPVVNGIPAAIVAAIANATMTETIFLIPGLGKMLPDSIAANNSPMVVGISFILTTLAVFAVLLGDIVMQIIDPRIQFATKSKTKSKTKLAKGEK